MGPQMSATHHAPSQPYFTFLPTSVQKCCYSPTPSPTFHPAPVAALHGTGSLVALVSISKGEDDVQCLPDPGIFVWILTFPSMGLYVSPAAL